MRMAAMMMIVHVLDDEIMILRDDAPSPRSQAREASARSSGIPPLPEKAGSPRRLSRRRSSSREDLVLYFQTDGPHDYTHKTHRSTFATLSNKWFELLWAKKIAR
jgi:hypothetical protein